MSSPDPKLNEVNVEVVKLFYNSDEVCRVMPGKQIAYQSKSVVSKYMNRNDCRCAI
jgi:hypothetical protein